MAKVSEEAKTRYSEKIREYKKSIEQISLKEKTLLQGVSPENTASSVLKVNAAEQNMNLVSYCILMNDVSVALLGIKNEAYLNDGRKACYKALILLEETVSSFIDCPFSDYEEKLSQLSSLSDEEKLRIVRKLGFSVDSVIDSYGDNSKWKWSFVELIGRFATIAKNMLDLKKYSASLDPRIEGYEARVNHYRMVDKYVNLAADRYREKYEMSTQRLDDIKLGVSYLSSLRRIYAITGEDDKIDVVKKKIEIWKAKMEADIKGKEQKGNKKI
jgi:hypothetical protein